MKHKFRIYVITFLAAFTTFFVCDVGSKAADVPGNADNVIRWVLKNSGFITDSDIFDSVFGRNNISNTFDEWEENHSEGGSSRSFSEFYNDNVSTDNEGNVTTSTEFNTFIYDSFKSYQNANPLSYSVQKIYGIDFVNSTYFYSKAQYDAFLNAVHNCGAHYVFCPGYSTLTSSSSSNSVIYSNNGSNVQCYLNNGSSGCVVFGYYDYKPLQFYSSSGHKSDYVQLSDIVTSYNWAALLTNISSSANSYMPPGMHVKCVLADGTVKDVNNFFRPSFSGGIRNSYSNINVNPWSTSVFVASGKTESTYVYDSINAIKVYNSGIAQPYYVTDPSIVPGGTISSTDLSNVGNTYNNIVNNITTGLTADEVQKIVEAAVKGNGGGSSSGGGTIDIGSLDVGSIKDGLNGVNGEYSSGFTSWLGSVFGFLPASLWAVLALAIALSFGYFILRLVRGF